MSQNKKEILPIIFCQKNMFIKKEVLSLILNIGLVTKRLKMAYQTRLKLFIKKE